MTRMRVISVKSRKRRKNLWFRSPTQLLIQGQWWSNLSTHLLQIEQCFDLSVLITSHSGHNWVESNFESSSMKGIYGFVKYPGFLFQDQMAKTIERMETIERAQNQRMWGVQSMSMVGYTKMKSSSCTRTQRQK